MKTMITGINIVKYKKWEIWFAKVKFEDSDEIKKRPVLILGEKNGFILSLKITTHTSRDSSDYALKYWAKAGLEKESVVMTSRVLLLNDDDLIRCFGRISEYDMLQIQNIMS